MARLMQHSRVKNPIVSRISLTECYSNCIALQLYRRGLRFDLTDNMG